LFPGRGKVLVQQLDLTTYPQLVEPRRVGAFEQNIDRTVELS